MTRQGSMKNDRKIAPMFAIMVVLSAALPASAWAGSLLSGYGGPGEGSQALLGSALLNGGGGGGSKGGSASRRRGGGSSRGPSASSGSSSAAGVLAGAQGPGGGAGPGSAPHEGALKTGPRRARELGGKPSAASAGDLGLRGGASTSAYPVSQRGAAPQGSGALGLSGGDLAYALLAFGMLAFTGVLTRRLVQGSPPQGADISQPGMGS
jgi:hypothetical protein